ncbi:hypothetical protein TYRP_018677 [Tyrophagus putrescentiae]|nr:hypothetical protein TYRP_018677 [Tyrophagus putrescentiae]
MPNSVSSTSSQAGSVGRLRTSGHHSGSGSGGGSGSHHHRGDHSSLHSHNSRRSVSPSDHIRERYANADRLADRLFTLNKFIYQGIEKFLDRQAVRDLIAAFDSDDIITAEGGLENDFFRHRLGSVDLADEEQLLTIVQEQGKTIFVQQSVLTDSRRAAFKGGKKSLSNGGKSLLHQFLGIIRVKLFNIHYRQSPAKRAQFDFEETAPNVGNDKETTVSVGICCC